MTAPALRVLGVDPGSRKAGWGLVDVVPGARGVRHVDNGAIFLDERAPLFERLRVLAQGLDAVVDEYRPTLAAVEDVFVQKGARSALILGQARGAALVTLARRELVVETQNTMQVKSRVTGRGRATKAQVQEMVRVLLGLHEVPFEDAADALAVAIACAVGRAGPLATTTTTAVPTTTRGGRSRRDGLAALARAQGKLR